MDVSSAGVVAVGLRGVGVGRVRSFVVFLVVDVVAEGRRRGVAGGDKEVDFRLSLFDALRELLDLSVASVNAKG